MKVKEIFEAEQAQGIESWSSLWWGDFEEAGIEVCYIAIVDGQIVGFQSINIDGLTVAIEVKDEFQGQGIARALIEYSGSIKPERNECPEFWSKING